MMNFLIALSEFREDNGGTRVIPGSNRWPDCLDLGDERVPEQAFPFEVPLDLARTLPPKVQQMIGFRSFHNSSNLGGNLWQHNYQELADHLELR